jgi:tetratricopeptide (TPR) repeat protein
LSIDAGQLNLLKALCGDAQRFMGARKFDQAMAKLKQAVLALPHPRLQWPAATWIFTGIGEIHFLRKDYGKSASCFMLALRCPDGLGNPYIHLRLGESLYEMGRIEAADNELTRAYMGGGRQIFQSEDPKYLNRLRAILKPPAGQSSL